MKNLAVPVLLLAITAGQAIRIESVVADESVKPTIARTRVEAVAKWHAGPYVGDYVCRIPHRGPGHLSLHDALANQSQDFDNIDQVYVVPAGGHTNLPSDRLEVDLDVLRSKNNETANFELLPGDRIFVLTDAASTENSGSTYVAPPAMVQQGIHEGPAKPDTVMVNVCVAELLPPSQNVNDEGSGSDDLEVEKKPSMEEDGAEWLAWAKKHGRLVIISQPEVITLDNQPAFIQVGTMVPTVASKLDTGGLSKNSQLEQTFVGLIVGLTPRISPEGLVNMELGIENAKVIGDGESGSSIRKTKIQTNISAKDGQTIVLGGLKHRFEEYNRSLVIAVTPQVNPKR